MYPKCMVMFTTVKGFQTLLCCTLIVLKLCRVLFYTHFASLHCKMCWVNRAYSFSAFFQASCVRGALGKTLQLYIHLQYCCQQAVSELNWKHLFVKNYALCFQHFFFLTSVRGKIWNKLEVLASSCYSSSLGCGGGGGSPSKFCRGQKEPAERSSWG
jgi:hypothetical protein